MLPAALMYGSNKDMSNAMRLSELNYIEMPIEMVYGFSSFDKEYLTIKYYARSTQIHHLSVYEDFLADVTEAFKELNLDSFLPLICSVTAAILHIRSGNLQVAMDLLGAQSNSLLSQESMDRDIFCNALFHCTAKMISDVLFR